MRKFYLQFIERTVLNPNEVRSKSTGDGAFIN